MAYRYSKTASSLGKPFGRSTIYGKADEHDTPYMTRVWLGHLRLHIFYRGDQDKDCHDHPWCFWTFPFHSYVEEVVNPYVACKVQNSEGFMHIKNDRWLITRRVVKAWRLHYRPASHCHRVIGRYTGRHEGEVPQTDARRIVTLVWRGNAGRSWGFLKSRDGRWCWTPWKDYVFGSGKEAPCSDG